ncbi:MAG: LysE family transporter, partial [Paramuribaculum sp.]|nr:LysE family transporter [Paramuribaculum sp.]
MESAVNIIITGILIGALISAPMGPIGMLVIQRTLNKGRMPAFVTGIGAALSDLIYCLLTGLGLSFVTDFIESNQN